jgi:hypothetical protein
MPILTTSTQARQAPKRPHAAPPPAEQAGSAAARIGHGAEAAEEGGRVTGSAGGVSSLEGEEGGHCCAALRWVLPELVGGEGYVVVLVVGREEEEDILVCWIVGLKRKEGLNV